MKFAFGTDPATELTRPQVLEQCAMLIALGRFVRRFGLTAVGVQYQQGLARSCAASDFAEGAIGSAERFPIPDTDGTIIRPGEAIPCINEVDMGSGIPQTMLWRLLISLGLPAETTLHDMRWGSEFDGKFYWDLEISGAVPFAHLKGGIAGATGYRQPPMYFPMGGATITGQCKAGTLRLGARALRGHQVIMHVGTGHAVELPAEEFERRRRATTYEWPLMNAVLDGVGRDDLMAGHQSNHITVAYVDGSAVARRGARLRGAGADPGDSRVCRRNGRRLAGQRGRRMTRGARCNAGRAHPFTRLTPTATRPAATALRSRFAGDRSSLPRPGETTDRPQPSRNTNNAPVPPIACTRLSGASSSA